MPSKIKNRDYILRPMDDFLSIGRFFIFSTNSGQLHSAGVNYRYLRSYRLQWFYRSYRGRRGYCADILWSDAQPGDWVFYPDNSHVGIICGRDEDGSLLVIHCASGANNVVITGTSGFISVARPDYFSDNWLFSTEKYIANWGASYILWM